MGAIVVLVGFLIVFPCFCIGALQVLRIVLGWREDAMRLRNSKIIYVDEHGRPIP